MIGIWLLSLVVVHDSGRNAMETRIVETPTYRIQVTRPGLSREFIRPAKEESVLDVMASLPKPLIPKLMKAKIVIIRGTSSLVVDWRGIARNGDSKTNYLLMAGDIMVIEFRGTR
jgi:hypothetical protein